jgi:hypothetical protein
MLQKDFVDNIMLGMKSLLMKELQQAKSARIGASVK